MLSASVVGVVGALCAVLLTWLVTTDCAAQHDPFAATRQDSQATARSELGHFSASLLTLPLAEGPRAQPPVAMRAPLRPWLIAAATTTAAFAASYAMFQGLSYKASTFASRAAERGRDFSLDFDARLRSRELTGAAQERANLLSKASDIFLAGTVAATGATLLIWLSGKRKRQDQQIRTLLGPMVVRAGGGSGAGLVLRNKF